MNRSRTVAVVTTLLTMYLSPSASAATFGFVDDFSSAGTNGWSGGSSASNPRSGGVGGPTDGYLLLVEAFPANFGARTTNFNYQGDWIATGIEQLSLRLNDVGLDDAFEIHVLISDGFLSTTWQYNIGFDPPSDCWERFVVDLTNSADWTRTRGSASFQAVLANVERVTIRHDVAPYLTSPDPISGDLGIDHIQLDQAPLVCSDPVADTDGDGDVDLADVARLFECVTGGCLLLPTECACLDRDGDGDIDVDDLAWLEPCLVTGGPNQPADPVCDD